MFKEELIKFLLSTENFHELDEWYMSDFDDKHVRDINYEQGYPMLIDCCEVWIQYPEYTCELIDIMGSIRNMISTNTFPDIFIENKQNILAIYFDTENRVRTIIGRVHEGDNIDEKLIKSSIESGIKDEKLIFAELFYLSNINWFV
ncbi:hypothetical protein [Psychrobacter sp. Pi2-1]|jgi:hypothetical protein|uniref:hypothetical protein n=1 Tax=Psychrobacter sp. Pi2-1 TaxID=2774131 RepID=UPI0019188D84|nr:hypothetical protein [Psychrobacter sp. Pi2-1]